MGKFVSNSSSDGKLLTNGEIGEDGVLVCSSDILSNCDYEVSSAGLYDDGLKWNFWDVLDITSVKSDACVSYTDVLIDGTIDPKVFRCWKKRIVQDSIRKRDIPGFECELIEAGFECYLPA